MKEEQETFFERVYRIVRQVPSGRVTSYGAIARYLASARSARMVGWAMNQSHHAVPHVPAHRVVNRQGLLTGKQHFATPTMMEELLRQEGTQVENDQIQNFQRLFWDPNKELPGL